VAPISLLTIDSRSNEIFGIYKDLLGYLPLIDDIGLCLSDNMNIGAFLSRSKKLTQI